ncbi:DUF4191 domain-containing protein [Mycetocola zhujimingii]|uniref:DUF4191 domain-containing protein n=1 Tax=Mycetocola zhujimingii TaxID=2079792 RepID=A0A2U1TGS5_9MICO|nr:DUF4191 domain-containing protein [Mycetocola zhujimingii]AWB86516.1 DUF4191 domain-containing protein [Mycetocola zhujimingii]PWC08066.1 DUF4191 domain-containing protein [Mycetocola zhujimingii]
MARKEKPAKAAKEPGRLKQMWQVFQMTRRYDKTAVWWILLAFFGSIAVSVALAILISGGSVFGLVLWIIAGVLAGILAAMIVLGRKAEKAAYGQIAGQPGAVGAVFRSSLPRGWQGSEMPVNANAKTQDAVYRAVGRGGVILVGEGPRSRVTRLVEDEKRKVKRVLPNVPVTVLYVGPDADSIPLHKLPKTVRKVKSTLTKPEVLAIVNRLSSLSSNGLPIPKGVDPFKVKPQRAR